MSIVTEQLLNTTIILDSNDINHDITNMIKLKLKEEVEGKCNSNGYIINDSIKLIKRDLGMIKTYEGKSVIKYHITYKANVISLTEGDEVEVYINNINKMGLLSYIKLGKKDVETFDDSPVIIMIPKDYFNDETTTHFDDVTVGMKLKVIILGSRDKFLSEKIQCVARPF